MKSASYIDALASARVIAAAVSVVARGGSFVTLLVLLPNG
jgi:hypothetical protein